MVCRLSLIAAASVVTVLLQASPARASCAVPAPSTQRLTRADAAFVGTLVSRRQADRQVVLTFAVERSYKGAIGCRSTCSTKCPSRPSA